MRILFYCVITCLLGWCFGLALASTRQEYEGEHVTPTKILEDIVWKANGDLHDQSQIIVTKLDKTTNTKEYWAENKLSGTLESVRVNISYYLQWIAYLALAGAGTLIIYNGLMLVISPMSPDQAGKVKNRILYIVAWVLLVTGFYFVLKILLAVYYDIFVGT